MQHQLLRRADARLAGAEILSARACDRDETKARQRIVERPLDPGPALRIETHAAAPREQCVEELECTGAPAAAAARHGLAAIVAFAHDLHLRGRGPDLDGALVHHPV